MVRPSNLVNSVDAGPCGSDGAGSQLTPALAALSPVESAAAGAGRGVLEGAFAVLDALGDAEDGLGLTALAVASGLAKSSAYRLAEKLTALGAVQRVERRYYIGSRIGRVGPCWQPDPVLRRAGQAPIHTLAVQSRAAASLRILREDRPHVICGTAPHGHCLPPSPTDRHSTARTATGRILYATTPEPDAALPVCWTPRDWRRLRECIRDLHAVVIDQQEVFLGICCVSAPVWRPDGSCAGAVTAVVQAAKPAPYLRDLVVCAARSISAGLR
jgi:DNA-binding IclR family transcriptional regulator